MAAYDPAAPATQRVQGPPLQAADVTPEEAARQGLGWVPRSHELYGKPGYVGSTPAAAANGGTLPTEGPGSPGTDGQNSVAGQGAAAQTYSPTPGAAPTNTTTNQGTQDVVRNSYLQRATAPVVDPRTRPEGQMQIDAYTAEAERARRDAVANNAEAHAGDGQVGAQSAEQRLINERAAQARGTFVADVVKQDLLQQRQDVENALSQLKGWINEDQNRELQNKLAEIDAQLKRESLSTSTELGNRELSLKDRLGTGSLNLDLIRTLLQDQQFNKNLGFNIGDREQYWNQVALDRILG